MNESSDTPPAPLAETPLHALHLMLGAKMTAFAGYDMPVNFAAGVLMEHLHTRQAASLFDVSHMGQAFLVGGDYDSLARALETLCPADILGLAPGRQRYTQLLNADGGIIDDLMVTRSSDPEEPAVLMLVVNASRKTIDFDHIAAAMPSGVKFLRAPHRALIALQGPKAAEIMARHAPEATAMAFMQGHSMKVAGLDCHVTRSGYTGEDGFEISVRAERATRLAQALLAEPEVKPAGLGARDSLRLEAGFCLYGHDIDETISPVEAGLAWSIGKRRRVEGGFPGAERIQRELDDGPARRRVGIRPQTGAPARETTVITAADGARVGIVTSGGFSPTLNAPISMGYVDAAHATPGTGLNLVVRGRPNPAEVIALPFVRHNYAARIVHG